jgi:membrane protein
LRRAGRIVAATVRELRAKDLTVRAAALTYYNVLSIVPFLAFAFSLLKGFGLAHRLIEESVRPYLRATFAGDRALLGALEQVLAFVERTNVSGLSLVGVGVLAYAGVTLLSTIEDALNAAWDVRLARPVLRKVTDYTTMMVVGPLLVAAAIALATAAASSTLVTRLRATAWLGDLVSAGLGGASIVLVAGALFALYMIMPNARPRWRSALLGGIVAGLLWHGLLLLHVKLQIGVAKYNALYSSFAAFPIFLVWLDASWVIVLVGAQLAASHQEQARLTYVLASRHVDQELREDLAVVLAAAVGRCFLDGRPPPTKAALAAALDVSPTAIAEVLEALVRAGVLVPVAGPETAYDPARDLDGVHLSDVASAVRRDGAAEAPRSALARAAGPDLDAALRVRHDEERRGAGELTLRELAARCAVPLA